MVAAQRFAHLDLEPIFSACLRFTALPDGFNPAGPDGDEGGQDQSQSGKGNEFWVAVWRISSGSETTYGVAITDEEAVQFRDAFFNEYQGLAAWHESARAAASDPGVTEIRTHRIGRRQHLADAEHWWQRFASVANTVIQGSCAEAVKLGLLDIGEKLKGRARLVSCIHDEIIVECDEAEAVSIIAEVQEIMMARSAQIFNGQTIGVEAHVEDNWAGVKGANPKQRVGPCRMKKFQLASAEDRQKYQRECEKERRVWATSRPLLVLRYPFLLLH